MGMIELKNITKEYVNQAGFKAVLFDNINLPVLPNIVTSIVAPSGSGKSSLLRIISGLERQTTGEITENKKVIYIPSEPSSFPWLNVKENILYGMDSIDEFNLSNVIKVVELEGYENHYPHNNSIGFRFRISLARSIMHRPDLICLDEPFNKLDDITRYEIYDLIIKVNLTFGTTFLLATTNITEAMYISNKIYLMKKSPGKIIDSFDVHFASERNRDILHNDEFVSLRAKIENSFKSHQSHHTMNFSI